jgi:hypothetical protein
MKIRDKQTRSIEMFMQKCQIRHLSSSYIMWIEIQKQYSGTVKVRPYTNMLPMIGLGT